VSTASTPVAIPVAARVSRRNRLLVAVAALSALAAGTGLAAAPEAEARPGGVKAPVAARKHPTLEVGDKGRAVKYLRKRFDLKRGNRFTPVLATRVAAFEARRGMRRDGGRVTSATWKALGVKKLKKRTNVKRRHGKPAPGTAAFSRAILAEAARHRGKPYVYGGNGPGAFDCSGFTRFVYARVGYSLPRTAAQQRGATRRISRAQLRPGDLVFVHSGSYVSHAAIYAGNGHWWESSRPGRPLGKNRAWTSSVSYGRV